MTAGDIVRVHHEAGTSWAIERASGALTRLPVDLGALLSMPLAEARAVVDDADGTELAGEATFLAPVDEQEVWAAGVTYLRSRDGRKEEASDGTPYDRVYAARRPELFFKSTPTRVVTDGDPVGIRADSDWNVPEAELGLVLNQAGDVFGYVVGNDMSSRSIEGENPLYLPQAKVYDRSCALGHRIVPSWLAPQGPWPITMRIDRAGATVFFGETSTGSIARDIRELGQWLVAGLEFPRGVVLLTGTGIVPDAAFTLAAGDIVTIEVAGIGSLTNTVTVVGRPTEHLQDHA